MATIVLLTDRRAEDALPALASAGIDPKVEPLSVSSLDFVVQLSPEAVLVDAAENPGQGFLVLRALSERAEAAPAIAIVERTDLERLPWDAVVDDLLYPGAPAAEIRLRIAIGRRRRGATDGSVIRLGQLAIDVDTYQVTVAGRPLDLTFKEFELLRFLAARPGRVFTRPALLREVWGYDFYGGTRTVDVHIRRLRAKLGPAHESLVETVRGVGYRAHEPTSEP
jgi:DNA-binding response OmpR family regulator